MRKLYLSALALLLGLGFASAASSQTYTYDDLGRVKTVVQPGGATSTYTYDNADNRTAVVVTLASSGSPPVCSNSTYTFPIPTNAPPQPVSITASNFFTSNCTSPSGYTLTLTSPTLPLNFTISQGQSLLYSYSVSDGHGGTASATETFKRQ